MAEHGFVEVVGNVHLHTIYSDGSGTFEEVAQAASQAGLDFVIPTDHHILVLEKEGWYDNILVLVGEETNDPDAAQQNHFLHFGITQDVAEYAHDPQAVIDATRRQGGFVFIAHPCEREARYIGEPAFNWTRQDVTGYIGFSIWNYMSEFKSHLSSLPRTLWAVAFPHSLIRGPFSETLALYDRLLAHGRQVPLLGASDAHANRYSLGPLQAVVFPYVDLFKTVNLHLLLHRRLSGDLLADKAGVYQAMGAGRGFVGYHVLGDPRGFRFHARNVAGDSATYGEVLSLGPGETVHLEVMSPLPARLRLLRNGEPIAEAKGKRLTYRSRVAGVYRVEAYRCSWLRQRGWVFTNPIYVRDPRMMYRRPHLLHL